MMSRRIFVVAIVLCLFLIISLKAFAAGSGALRIEVPDAGPFGMGSAFVGQADRPSAVYYNPAGLTQIKKEQFSDGFAVVAPQISYTDSSGVETQARQQTFLVPHFYTAMPLGFSKAVLGFGANSSWGTGVYWAEDSFARYQGTNGELENLDAMLTLAYPLTEQWSFAVSADADDSKASTNKKVAQAGVGDDANFQLKAKSLGWGYRLATMFKINDQHQVGLMYRSPIRHKFRGKAYLNDLNDNGTYPLNTIFGGGSYGTELSEEYVLPQSIILGYSFKPTSKWVINADAEWMDWRSVQQERINWEDETDPDRLGILNNGNPVQHDWEAVWSEAVGVQYSWSDRLRLRGGYFHIETPIPQQTFDSSLPDSDVDGLTTGFGYDIKENLTFDFAYSAVMYRSRKVFNTVGQNGGGLDISGTYRQFTNVGMVTITYKFK